MATQAAERLFAEGVALHRQERTAEAAQSYAAACAADPSHLAARYNLAVALQAMGRDVQAEAAYRDTLALKPDLVQALNNLANLVLAQDRVDEALQALTQATKAVPDFAPTWNNLGNVLMRMGRVEEARQHFERALARDATFVEARVNLGQALLALGRHAEALPHLEAALAASPDDASLRFQRDAAAGTRPPHPPHEFVATLFDHMAAQFDAHLVGKLGYRIPDRLAEVLGPWLDARLPPRRALDLGCGTGLVAEALRGRCEDMRGVDLSPKMVDKARARGLYAAVTAGDLLAFLSGQGEASADLIVAADVFVYVGDLAAVTMQAARVLATSGRLAFTVEGAGPGEDYTLLPMGRYAHSAAYVDALARASGFQILHAGAENIRAERGVPVAGRLYVLEKR